MGNEMQSMAPELQLTRFYTPFGTLGTLVFPSGETFATIERPWLDNAAYKSCIPEGEYTCVPYSSAKFPDVFEITEVPERTYILFHVANFVNDVQGCIGVGKRGLLHNGKLMVAQSADAFDRFKELLEGEESFKINIVPFIAEYP